MTSSVNTFFLVLTGVLCIVGDSPPFNPDQELCAEVDDECVELDGMCCEGLRGGCCENGICLTNSIVCKLNGERCGRVRCSVLEECLRSQPCVCCEDCSLPILPTCEPKCGDRACYWNEGCWFAPNGQNTCADKRYVV